MNINDAKQYLTTSFSQRAKKYIKKNRGGRWIQVRVLVGPVYVEDKTYYDLDMGVTIVQNSPLPKRLALAHWVILYITDIPVPIQVVL